MLDSATILAARLMRAACFVTVSGLSTGQMVAAAGLDGGRSPTTGSGITTSSTSPKPAAPATSMAADPTVQPKATPRKPAKPIRPSKPAWNQLSPARQHALAPLVDEWDAMGGTRKKKWLEIADRFPSMNPDEQQRLQNRMRDWVKLTPQQRRTARESFARAKKLKPAEKSAQWQQYQQLPEERKKQLAAEAAASKRVTTLPPPSRQPKAKEAPPPKSALKPGQQQKQGTSPNKVTRPPSVAGAGPDRAATANSPAKPAADRAAATPPPPAPTLPSPP